MSETTRPVDPTTHAERIAVTASALARHGIDGPAALASLTEEELLALTGSGDSSRVQTPWLDRFAPDDDRRSLLITAARRSMIARGVIALERTMAAAERRHIIDGGDDLVPAALLAGIVGRRAISQRCVTMHDLAAGDPPSMTAIQLFADAAGSVLQEQVSHGGIHHFVMGSVADAVHLALTWIAGAPDGASKSATTDDPHHLHVGTLAELSAVPTLGPVIGAPARAVRIVAEDRASGETTELRVHHNGARIVALRHAEDLGGEGDERFEAVSVHAEDLSRQLEEMLTV